MEKAESRSHGGKTVNPERIFGLFLLCKGTAFSRGVIAAVINVALATEGLRCLDELRVPSAAEAQLSTHVTARLKRCPFKFAVFSYYKK